MQIVPENRRDEAFLLATGFQTT